MSIRNIDEMEIVIRNSTKIGDNSADFSLAREILEITILGLGEAGIIRNIRKKYKEKNIQFNIVRNIPSTLLTEHGQIYFQRTLLSPKTSEDAQRLMELEGSRGVYPLDIALGISKLPFKMTVNASK
ncbi:MAG: hypothetical protein LBF22_14185 [Deltaproteobacteria bacterium]|jgi:hypothetical protein|nr:hypothetical protein [Deltaproteobacteria bacterium]